jgi:hypothetical protein
MDRLLRIMRALNIVNSVLLSMASAFSFIILSDIPGFFLVSANRTLSHLPSPPPSLPLPSPASPPHVAPVACVTPAFRTQQSNTVVSLCSLTVCVDCCALVWLCAGHISWVRAQPCRLMAPDAPPAPPPHTHTRAHTHTAGSERICMRCCCCGVRAGLFRRPPCPAFIFGRLVAVHSCCVTWVQPVRRPLVCFRDAAEAVGTVDQEVVRVPVHLHGACVVSSLVRVGVRSLVHLHSVCSCLSFVCICACPPCALSHRGLCAA